MSTPKYFFTPDKFGDSDSCPYPPTWQRLTSSVRLSTENSPVPDYGYHTMYKLTV